MMIRRDVALQINKRLQDNKVLILLGPRQVGKTTLFRDMMAKHKNVLWWNGDESDIRDQLAKPTSVRLKKLIGKSSLLVIDEAQRIENIGIVLKLIYDNITGVKVLVTGSSAFELNNRVNEPLTGRKWEYMLYPISFGEMIKETSLLDEKRVLEHRLIYGYYPDVINNPGNEEQILKQLSDSYLYKDILTWERIQKPDRMERLVKAIAFQVGSQVSYNELGQMAGLDNETVEHYINLLEKAFVVFRLGVFSRNLRNELKKSRKIYFYDNGIRNAIINQFNPLGLRNDKGALWENFLIAERMKKNAYSLYHVNRFFWRNQAQNEIDYIEERNGKLKIFEFKWQTKNRREKHRFPKAFMDAYKPGSAELITQDNYEDFIL